MSWTTTNGEGEEDSAEEQECELLSTENARLRMLIDNLEARINELELQLNDNKDRT